MTEAGAPVRLNRMTLTFVLAVVLLNTLSLGIVSPVLPILVKQLANGNTVQAAEAVGVFAAAWAAMQLLFAPVLGVLSDRYGRRPVILLAMLQLSVDYIVMALATTLAWLFVGRLFSGMAAAGRAAMFAYAADVAAPEERARYFGLLSAVGAVGTILGPVVGGLLGQFSPRAPFWAAAAVGLINAAYGFFVLKESLPKSNRAAFSWARANPFGALMILVETKGLMGLAAMMMLANIALAAFGSIYVLYVNYRYGWGPGQAGLVLTVFAAGNIAAQALLAGPAVKRLGERRAIVIAFASGALGLVLIGLGGPWLLWVGLLALAPVNVAVAAIQSLRSQLVEPGEQGRLQGAMISLAGLAGMVGPVLFAETFAWSVGPGRGLNLPGLAMLGGAGVFALALLLTLVVISPKAKAKPRGTIQVSKRPRPEQRSALGPRPAALGFIYTVILMNTISMGVIIPVFPTLVKQLGHIGDAQGAQVMGLFGATWAAMSLIFAPIFGNLSDRFGRRPVLLVSMFGLAFDYVIMALAPNLAWLFIGRVISGITASSGSAAGAYVADISTEDDRARNFGRFQAAANAGILLGPALGGFVGSWNPRAPFWVAAGLALANGLYGLFIVPESLSHERRAPFRWSRANPIGAIGLLMSKKGLLGLASIYFLAQLANQTFSVFQFYTHFRYGWGPFQVGLLLMVLGAGGIVVSSSIAGAAAKWLGERGAVLAGTSLALIGFVVAGLAVTQIWFWASMMVFIIAGIAYPSLASLLSKRVGVNQQGQLQGAQSILFGLTGLVGPIVFSDIFAWSIGPGGGWRLPGLSMLGGGLVTLAGLGMAFIYARPSATLDATP